ncbi:hypothetical protein [Pedobacter sp.]|uniref:tetratricopeptide repeat protein n=1 Tax=Pedobacter sp. TaxID=1411316 RepID=UPI0031D5D9B7
MEKIKQIKISIAFLLILSINKAFPQKNNKCDFYFEKGNISINVGPSKLSNERILLAIDSYTKAIICDKKFWQAYRNRGKLLILLKKYKLALDDFNKAIKIVGQNSYPDLLLKRSTILYELGEYQRALIDLNQAISLMGNPSYAYLLKAKVNWKLGKNDEACRDLKKALKDNPQYIDEVRFIKCATQ